MLQMVRNMFQAERRSTKRRKAFLPATFIILEEPQPIYLLNITTEGALGYAIEPAPIGMWGTLRVGDVQTRANILWVRGSSFGMRFGDPLEASMVDKLLRSRWRLSSSEGGHPS